MEGEVGPIPVWGFFGLEVHLDPALEVNDWMIKGCSVIREKAWPGFPSIEDFWRPQVDGEAMLQH